MTLSPRKGCLLCPFDQKSGAIVTAFARISSDISSFILIQHSMAKSLTIYTTVGRLSNISLTFKVHIGSQKTVRRNEL